MIITLDATNHYVTVNTESDERNILCKFLTDQQDVLKERRCTVFYGKCIQSLTHKVEGSIRNGSQISIQLHNTDLDAQTYCYAVIASNGTFSVFIEGKFSSATNTCKNSINTTSLIPHYM